MNIVLGLGAAATLNLGACACAFVADKFSK